MSEFNKELIWKEKGNKWHYGDEFIEYLKKELSTGISFEALRKKIGVNYSVLKNIFENENLNKNKSKNGMDFKELYQDYDWCYEMFVNRGMNHEEMAIEANCSKRVIEKWCCEKHKINQSFRRKNKKLNKIQKDLIIGSMLGDGHIDNRENSPLFIVSHAENQKDYLFWKYEILKDFFNMKPVLSEKNLVKHFKTGYYKAKPYYRISSRVHDCFLEIRDMSVFDLIKNLNEFSFCIHMLDDGSRTNSNWQTCVAPYSEEEVLYMIKSINKKFGIKAYICKSDNRYINFTSNDSRKIDDMILRNIHNELDIVKYKILDKNITKETNSMMINTENGRMRLSSLFGDKNIYDYEKIIKIYKSGVCNSEEIINVYNRGEL